MICSVICSIFADYPIRVDGITIHDPKNEPRFPILSERYITKKNDLLSNKRKDTELKKTPNF